MEQQQLSSALRITNVNDFLAPTTSCILPFQGGIAPAGSVLSPIIPTDLQTPSADDDGGVATTATSTGQEPARQIAKVTVSDCLSCSGCVTSSETILLSNENIEKLEKFASTTTPSTQKSNSMISIAIISQQSVASLSVYFQLSMDQTIKKISTFLNTHYGIKYVVDSTFAKYISVYETSKQFIQHYRKKEKSQSESNSSSCLPFITSICPGWLTYAEKTQDEQLVLSKLSTVPSTQSIFHHFLQYLFPTDDQHSSDKKYWVLSVSPCHDRKLESIKLNEPDCVITTSELLDLITIKKEYSKEDFQKLNPSKIHFTLDEGEGDHFGGYSHSTSDGYAYHAAYLSCIEILKMNEDDIDIQFENISKSGDVQVAVVKQGDLELRFATAYGFRSLQNVIRKVKKGQCHYDFIELMACPGGCTNGGGQVAYDTHDRLEMKKLLSNVNRLYYNDAPKYNLQRLVNDHQLFRKVYDDTQSDKYKIEIKSRKQQEEQFLTTASLDCVRATYRLFEGAKSTASNGRSEVVQIDIDNTSENSEVQFFSTENGTLRHDATLAATGNAPL